MNKRPRKAFLKGKSPWFLPVVLGLALLLSLSEIYYDTYPSVVTEDDNLQIRACFTPNHSCRDRLLKRINKASSEILILCYSFTDARVADALLEAVQRGVTVSIVADKTQRTQK